MGQRPTYTFLLMSEREAEPRINHYLDTRQVCIDIHSSAAPCLFPLPQSGFFGSRGLFPKKYPSGVWGETPHYIFFTVGAQYLKLLPAVSESLHRQTFCRLALPFSLPLPGFFGFLGFFFPKKNPKRSARRSLAYALFPMSGCGVETPHNPFLTAREARIGERLSEQHPKIRRSQARGARRRMPCPDRCCQDSDGRA